MAKKEFDLKKHIEYMEFLEKRLNSKNYKANVSSEEYEKTKAKYDKAKLILKFYNKKS
jgi:hypothetical protein